MEYECSEKECTAELEGAEGVNLADRAHCNALCPVAGYARHVLQQVGKSYLLTRIRFCRCSRLGRGGKLVIIRWRVGRGCRGCRLGRPTQSWYIAIV